MGSYVISKHWVYSMIDSGVISWYLNSYLKDIKICYRRELNLCGISFYSE